MKASDSVNSLTGLNETQDTNQCFICLEESNLHSPLVDSTLLRNCGCKFHVHSECWNVWIQNKTDFDCPICHRASMLKIHIPPNPVLVFQEQIPPETNQRRLRIFYCVVFALVVVISSIMIDQMIHSG